jgi:hypothetical protein
LANTVVPISVTTSRGKPHFMRKTSKRTKFYLDFTKLSITFFEVSKCASQRIIFNISL